MAILVHNLDIGVYSFNSHNTSLRRKLFFSCFTDERDTEAGNFGSSLQNFRCTWILTLITTYIVLFWVYVLTGECSVFYKKK